MYGNPRHTRSSTTLRASDGSMAWLIEHDSSAGTMFRLSMMTLANLAAGQLGRDLRGCWRQSVKVESGQLCHLKLHAWHGTAVIGTRCWSSAAWSAHCLSMKTPSTIRVHPMTDCCSA